MRFLWFGSRNMANRALRVLFFYNGIFILGGSLLGPLYAIFVSEIDNNILAVSITWSVFLLSTTLFIFIISKIGDQIKEKEYLMMAGYLVRAIAWFLFVFTTSISQLVVLQILLGLGEALGTPAFDAIFAEHLDSGKHIAEYSDWKMIQNIVLAIGALSGGLIVANFGFNVLFLLMSILAMLSFLGIYLKPRELL